MFKFTYKDNVKTKKKVKFLKKRIKNHHMNNKPRMLLATYRQYQ